MPEQDHAISGGTSEEATGHTPDAEFTLPEAVRQRVINLAAVAMTGMPGDEVPTPVRRVAQFAPNRRARLGASAIAIQLASDPTFRQRIATRVVEATGELGAAVRDGTPPAAADPVEVAALAYLTRPERWADLLAAATQALRADAESGAIVTRLAASEQQVARAEHERAVAKVEAEKLRDELSRLRAEAAGLRDETRTLARGLREAQARERKAVDTLATERGRAGRAAADADAEQRRLRARLAEAELAASGARAQAKATRAVDDARLWLLLETIGQAAAGLRRDLALQPPARLPA